MDFRFKAEMTPKVEGDRLYTKQKEVRFTRDMLNLNEYEYRTDNTRVSNYVSIISFSIE